MKSRLGPYFAAHRESQEEYREPSSSPETPSSSGFPSTTTQLCNRKRPLSLVYDSSDAVTNKPAKRRTRGDGLRKPSHKGSEKLLTDNTNSIKSRHMNRLSTRTPRDQNGGRLSITTQSQSEFYTNKQQIYQHGTYDECLATLDWATLTTRWNCVSGASASVSECSNMGIISSGLPSPPSAIKPISTPSQCIPRAPPMGEQGHMPDKPRSYPDLTEPFMVSLGQLGDDKVNDVKVIWWYIAALDGSVVAGSGVGMAEEEFAAEFFSFDEALKKLCFQNDGTVLEKAI